MTRTYRPGGGGRAYPPKAAERRSGLAPSGPAALRPLWLKALEACVDAVGQPDAQPLDFMHQLRALDARTFPIGTADARRGFAKSFLDDARLWVAASGHVRGAWADALRAKAVALQDLLIEAGSVLAAQSRARQGLGD